MSDTVNVVIEPDKGNSQREAEGKSTKYQTVVLWTIIESHHLAAAVQPQCLRRHRGRHHSCRLHSCCGHTALSQTALSLGTDSCHHPRRLATTASAGARRTSYGVPSVLRRRRPADAPGAGFHALSPSTNNNVHDNDDGGHNNSSNNKTFLHCEPIKSTPKCFCHSFYKSQSILIKFDTHCLNKFAIQRFKCFLAHLNNVATLPYET